VPRRIRRRSGIIGIMPRQPHTNPQARYNFPVSINGRP
jgi:hypothetical protein